MAVVLGHMYPVFHRFQGGKGVATALGVLLALNWWLALGTLATWSSSRCFSVIRRWRRWSSAVFAAFFTLILFNAAHPFVWSVTLIAALLIWRHRSNIRNLLAGRERKLGAKADGILRRLPAAVSWPDPSAGAR